MAESNEMLNAMLEYMSWRTEQQNNANRRRRR